MAAPPRQPLPANQPLGVNPCDVKAHPAWYGAYDQCLQLQIGSSQQQLYARCLGYLLHEAVDETSRDYLAAEIIHCMGDVQQLKYLAKFYINHIFRLCKLAPPNGSLSINANPPVIVAVRQSKGGMPALSHHPGRESLKFERESFYAAAVKSAPKDHLEAKKAVSFTFFHLK